MLGFVFGALVLWLAQPTPDALLAGTAIAVLGEALRVWAAGHLNKSREVTSSGPYRWFAHPLYVGSSVMGAGLAVASGSALVALLIGGYLAVTITAAVKSEERFLRGRFGDRYERYRHGRELADGDAARRFSLGQALTNREYRAAIGVRLAWWLPVAKAAWSSR